MVVIAPRMLDVNTFVYNGNRYPFWAIAGGFGFASTFVTEIAHNYIMPHIVKEDKLRHYESIALSLVSSGLSYVILARLLSNNNIEMGQMRNLFIAGASS